MKRFFLSTLMLLGVAAAAGVSPALAQDKPLDKLSVRLDFSPWGVQAAMHLAQNKGWFKEAHLDVDIQDGRGSAIPFSSSMPAGADIGQVPESGWLARARQGHPPSLDRHVSSA